MLAFLINSLNKYLLITPFLCTLPGTGDRERNKIEMVTILMDLTL